MHCIYKNFSKFVKRQENVKGYHKPGYTSYIKPHTVYFCHRSSYHK